MTERIVIVGAGAIGCYFGAHMARAGLSVTLFDPWSRHVEHVRQHGVRIDLMGDDAGFDCALDLRDISAVQGLIREGPVDVAFIAVKAYDTGWATEMIRPYLAPDGIVVSLQNSCLEPVVAAVAGPERTFGCAINALSAELVAPGHVRRMSRAGDVGVGAFDPARTRQAEALMPVLATAERTSVVEDLAGAKWSKLVINTMRNGLSAMTGMTGRERDTDPLTMAIGMRLGAQTVRVGRALGLRLVSTGYDFDMLAAAGEGDRDAAAAIGRRMAEISGGRSADQRPSMAQDIAKGRRTETDAINGLVARKGLEVGIDATPHQRVHETILRIERGLAAPSRDLAKGILPEGDAPN